MQRKSKVHEIQDPCSLQGILDCFYIKELLKTFVETEYLEGQDQYDCEKCKRKQNATKKFTIDTLPQVYNSNIILGLMLTFEKIQVHTTF